MSKKWSEKYRNIYFMNVERERISEGRGIRAAGSTVGIAPLWEKGGAECMEDTLGSNGSIHLMKESESGVTEYGWKPAENRKRIAIYDTTDSINNSLCRRIVT